MSGVEGFLAYRASLEIDRVDAPYYALIMAAMRRADSSNLEKLRQAWPEVWDELQARYEAPGGVLDTDPDSLKIRVWGTTENPRVH